MKELTDEQLNIAICEWKGLLSADEAKTYFALYPATQVGITARLPSHITGIEALGNMHEAEKGLTTTQQIDEYTNWIREEAPCGKGVFWNLVHATARQRAIALLRVVKPELFQ